MSPSRSVEEKKLVELQPSVSGQIWLSWMRVTIIFPLYDSVPTKSRHELLVTASATPPTCSHERTSKRPRHTHTHTHQSMLKSEIFNPVALHPRGPSINGACLSRLASNPHGTTSGTDCYALTLHSTPFPSKLFESIDTLQRITRLVPSRDSRPRSHGAECAG